MKSISSGLRGTYKAVVSGLCLASFAFAVQAANPGKSGINASRRAGCGPVAVNTAGASAAAAQPVENFWVADGPVGDIVESAGTVYISGGFNYVGPNTGCGAVLDATSGALRSGLQRAHGEVHAAVPDCAGGWFVAFDTPYMMDDYYRSNNVLHFVADYSCDATWNLLVRGYVYALAMREGILYMGGDFTAVNGEARENLAAVNVATGNLTDWNPSASGAMDDGVDFACVNAFAFSTNTLFVGGKFTYCGGYRTLIAEVDLESGQATDWRPTPGLNWFYKNEEVNAIVITNDTVYLGGQFKGWMWGVPVGPTNFAAYSLSTGNVISNQLGSAGAVFALAADESVLYVGGVAMATHDLTCWYTNGLVALDMKTGAITGWNPDPGPLDQFQINALAVSDNAVYVGGYFSEMGGRDLPYLAAVDKDAGDALDWNPPQPNTVVNTLALSDENVFVGGRFISLGCKRRSHIAALDVATGAATDWAPEITGLGVNSIAVGGGIVYVGGYFDEVNGVSRNNLAAINRTTGAVTAWDPDPTNSNPQASDEVTALAVSGARVYVGGYWNNIGGKSRNRLAAIDASTGLALDWIPSEVTTPRTIVPAGDVVYVGGEYSGAIAFSASTGQATGWRVYGGSIPSLALAPGVVYLAGAFSEIGGQARSTFAAVDIVVGVPTAWNPNANASGQDSSSLALYGSTVYAGGCWTSIGGADRNGLAALDMYTAQATDWDTGLDVAVSSAPLTNYQTSVGKLKAYGGRLYVGGNFKSFRGAARPCFAVFDIGGGGDGESRLPAGYDADAISDFAVYDNNTGNWYVQSVSGEIIVWATAWGWPGALPVPGDYDGDGRSDLAVFDGNTGFWYVLSPDGALIAWAVPWGWPGAVPVPGDYDGDLISDLAVFDNNSGLWYVSSVSGTIIGWGIPWGWPGAVPVSGDFSGDRQYDFAVFDQNTGFWYALASDQTTVLAWGIPWGWPGATPVSGDYDGDGIADLAVFDNNAGAWYIRSVSGQTIAWAVPWGWPGAVPVPGDYDGDGIADLAVFDGNTGKWYVCSVAGTTIAWAIPWGWPGATPVPGAAW